MQSGNGAGGPYFILFIASFWYVVIFGIWLGILWFAVPHEFTAFDRNFPQWKLMLIGFMDSLNGLLIVFSSPPDRTSPMLQSILSQSTIPFTIGFRLLMLGKSDVWQQLLASGCITIGLLLTLAPTFEGGEPTPGSDVSPVMRVVWPFIFIVGFIPAAVMNVLDESVLTESSSGPPELYSPGHGPTARLMAAVAAAEEEPVAPAGASLQRQEAKSIGADDRLLEEGLVDASASLTEAGLPSLDAAALAALPGPAEPADHLERSQRATSGFSRSRNGSVSSTSGRVAGVAANRLGPAAVGAVDFSALVAAPQQQLHTLVFLFLTSFYQLVSMALFFWVDLIPGYGLSDSLSDFWSNFSGGWACFFFADGCGAASFAPGMVFVLAYVVSYLCTAALMRYSFGATWTAVVSTLVTPLGVLFWSLFVASPTLHWAPAFTAQTGWALGGLLFILPSVYVYQLYAE